MEEEFYATIKLTSGEEIIAKVSYDSDDDVVVILEPRLIEKVSVRKNGMLIEGIVFDDWINATRENMFILPRNQIITMIESDENFAECYEDHLKNRNMYRKKPTTVQNERQSSGGQQTRQNPKTQEGFLGSIKQAKKNLEDIYNES